MTTLAFIAQCQVCPQQALVTTQDPWTCPRCVDVAKVDPPPRTHARIDAQTLLTERRRVVGEKLASFTTVEFFGDVDDETAERLRGMQG